MTPWVFLNTKLNSTKNPECIQNEKLFLYIKTVFPEQKHPKINLKTKPNQKDTSVLRIRMSTYYRKVIKPRFQVNVKVYNTDITI